MAQTKEPPDLTDGEMQVAYKQDRQNLRQKEPCDINENSFKGVSSILSHVHDHNLSVNAANPVSVLKDYTMSDSSVSQSRDTALSDTSSNHNNKDRIPGAPYEDLQSERQSVIGGRRGGDVLESKPDGDVASAVAMPSSCIPNFDLISTESDSDTGEDSEEFLRGISRRHQDFNIDEKRTEEQELDVSEGSMGSPSEFTEASRFPAEWTSVETGRGRQLRIDSLIPSTDVHSVGPAEWTSVLGIKGRLDSTSSTCSITDDDCSTVTPILSPEPTQVYGDIPARYIPNFVHSMSRNGFPQGPFSSPLSTVGSTAPREHFSTDLVEDGIPYSRRPQLIWHNVKRGTVDDLDQFVDKHVYRADPNTGILISERKMLISPPRKTYKKIDLKPLQKLNPQHIDDEWFYREGQEYTILQENHPSICICRDSQSEEKFVRKQRKRSKFEGQKKSVLVPLKHSESPHIMDIYGLIVLLDDVYIFMEYCEGGCLTHTKPRAVQETFECIERILETICYIHFHGLVHGDIKPENICLRSPDDLTSLCLIDFEFVRTPETQPQFRGFTTQFLPPWWPKLKNCSKVCHAELRSMDLWATACIAVCLLTGKRPWSVQVKEFKKHCTNCPPRACTCDLLQKLQQHIIDHGNDILEKHLDRESLQASQQGKSLWKTLTFLTTNDNMCESKAKEALNILTDEEEEKIAVEIHYKTRLVYETAVEPGTSVQELLDRPHVKMKLNSMVKKWILALPTPDHKITSACMISVRKEKTHLAEKIVNMLKIGR